MEGFLPNSRASFILDLIVVAMALVIPVMLYSLAAVRRQRNYEKHRFIQISLGVTLGLAILAFEVDMRWNGWRHLAEASPYYQTWVFPALYIHLFFAIPTLFLWVYTIYMATRHRINQATGGRTRFEHKKYGRLSAYTMIATTITGWIFYYLAFLAS
jgi:uncharacterized membrane protein YozB (DUF420 family)